MLTGSLLMTGTSGNGRLGGCAHQQKQRNRDGSAVAAGQWFDLRLNGGEGLKAEICDWFADGMVREKMRAASQELETLTMNMKLLKLDPDQTLEESPNSVSECNADAQQTLPYFKKFNNRATK
ncbi:hypothetical protein E3N88_15492 [Mikania micrantha]|uniref:Uncharacterized protein n=1 Tax=Mikania micrantha TaxID=192012 RepID=A0A5N6NW55_9ASTR|nr:hypothetical protein E3N88_15492 [Mikania micrantha]